MTNDAGVKGQPFSPLFVERYAAPRGLGLGGSRYDDLASGGSPAAASTNGALNGTTDV
jgi:hypothetical protein